MKDKLRFVAAACLLVMPLVYAGTAAGADRTKAYLTDGAVQVSPGVYANPGDGFCVSGIKADGTMTVVPGITNFRDCVAYTTSLTAMVATDVTARSTCPTSGVAPYNKACNVSTNCSKVDGSLTWVAALQKCFDTSACTVQGAADADSVAHACAVPNDGAKHTYSASLCIDSGTRAGVTRKDLDNTAANCQEKGGVLSDGLYGHPYGACSAYGWVYGGVKADGSLPDISGGRGVTSAAGLGFCYASMRMTSAPGYNVGTAGGCPSYHNSATGNAAEWPAGTDGVAYQTIASYDAGLGWSFASSQCLYQYGVKGVLGADLRGPNGVIPPISTALPLCAGATGTSGTAGTCVDLTGITTQGDCLAIGGGWDNWLPRLADVAPGAAPVAVATSPIASTIRKLDAKTSEADGGAKFYSGTGSVCLKCHSDQSRAYMERYKPGFVETPHKLAGDEFPATWNPSTEWGIKGVQCTVCHATGKPTQQDVGLVIYPNTTGTNAGLPRAASGHNQTEYGSHLTGVCYYCHGTQASPVTTNPASVIPANGTDFVTTAKGLAPIVNQFLNSPHANYSGDSKTVSVITKTNYSSQFKGNICRTGAEVTDAATAANGVDVTALSTCGAGGVSSCNSAANCPATPSGNRVWNAITAKCYDRAVCAGAAAKAWDATTNRCVETQTTCEAQSDSGYPFIWSPTGSAGNPSIITSSGAGCFKAFGNGSIVTTVWNGSAADKIPNLDTAANAACTTGAASFWTPDGEAASTANSVAVAATDQGNCMTCHDVHWKIGSALPDAEPIRRECTTCHSHPTGEASVTNAPQVDLSKINHPGGSGTPLANVSTDPTQACEICHMPKSSASGSPMHLWRVNTSAAYQTMGATKANTDANGAAYVDLDFSCGQCHGGSAGSGATANGAPYISKVALATYANDIHKNKPTAAFTASVVNATKTLNVNAAASLCDGSVNNCDSFSWSWGTTPPSSTTVSKPTVNPWLASKVYAAAGSYIVQLTVSYLGVTSSTSRTITISDVTPPTVGGSCTFNPDLWKVSVTDTTSSAGSKTITKVVLNWGDGTPYGVSTIFPVTAPGMTHIYPRIGSFTVQEQVYDSGGMSTTSPLACSPAVAPAYFTIAGKITKKDGITPIASAVVRIMNGATIVASVFTNATGDYSSGAVLKPGSYTVTPMLAPYTFGSLPVVAVGPSKTPALASAVNISATAP